MPIIQQLEQIFLSLVTATISWVTAASATLTSDSVDWSGYTIRQIINSAQLSNTGKNYIRITFEAASTQGFTVDAVYVGHAAAAGDVYDFESTPTQITFNSGSAGFAIAAGATIVSDQVAFSIQAGKNLIIAFHVSGDASHDDFRRLVTLTGWSGYWKAATSDASTVNATGYTGPMSNAVSAIKLIEVG